MVIKLIVFAREYILLNLGLADFTCQSILIRLAVFHFVTKIMSDIKKDDLARVGLTLFM